MNTPTSEAHVLSQQDGHTLILTLNRPQARNAYSEEMIDLLCEALDQAELNRTIRTVLITGAGACFSAGGDLKLMRDKQGMFEGDQVELRTRYMQNIHRIPRRLARFTKPLIAVINGPAIGAGLDLALMCDLRVASSKAQFGSTFVKVGLIPGDGGAYYLTRAIGLAKALELTLTGRVIDAQEAKQLGILNHLVNPDELMSTAQALADEINANAPIAVQLTKAATYQSLHQSPEAALQIAANFQGIAQNTSDHLEGVHAILEKRSPQFEGR